MDENNIKINFKIDDYLFVDPSTIKKAVLEWIGERQAQKRYSKPVDIFIINNNNSLNIKATEKLLNLSKNLNLDDEIFYKTEKMLSYNNGNITDAEIFWLIDWDGLDPVVTLLESKDVISKTEFKNQIIEIMIRKQVVKIDNATSIEIVEIRNADGINYQIFKNKEYHNQISEEEFNNLSKDIINQINYVLEPKEWPIKDELPFIHLKNNPNAKSDFNYIQTEMDDLIVLQQKKRDDILYSSVKVVGGGIVHKNKNKSGNAEEQALIQSKKYASSSVIVRDNTSLPDQPSSIIANAIPNTDTYDRGIRTILNTMLKKTGGATDVDSKGTVQQSKGEILQSNGDEFKVSKWKEKNRQAKIQKLFTILWKVYTTILKQTQAFSQAFKLFVLISQEEVLSETELIDNLKKANDYGFSNPLISFARYNNMNIIDAYYLKKLNTDNNGDIENEK